VEPLGLCECVGASLNSSPRNIQYLIGFAKVARRLKLSNGIGRLAMPRRPEDDRTLLVAILVGAALGIAFGFEAALWTGLGVVIVGGSVYLWQHMR
jgi:hypothetical protein